jgi:hypothetical protein
MDLRNVCNLTQHYTSSQTGRRWLESSPPWKSHSILATTHVHKSHSMMLGGGGEALTWRHFNVICHIRLGLSWEHLPYLRYQPGIWVVGLSKITKLWSCRTLSRIRHLAVTLVPVAVFMILEHTWNQICAPSDLLICIFVHNKIKILNRRTWFRNQKLVAYPSKIRFVFVYLFLLQKSFIIYNFSKHFYSA